VRQHQQIFNRIDMSCDDISLKVDRIDLKFDRVGLQVNRDDFLCNTSPRFVPPLASSE
jgi:hypothetical protein